MGLRQSSSSRGPVGDENADDDTFSLHYKKLYSDLTSELVTSKCRSFKVSLIASYIAFNCEGEKSFFQDIYILTIVLMRY